MYSFTVGSRGSNDNPKRGLLDRKRSEEHIIFGMIYFQYYSSRTKCYTEVYRRVEEKRREMDKSGYTHPF